MATYLIGDVQGCFSALKNLLQKVQYSPSTDTLYLLGDLVNRGPDSLSVLRYCREHEGSIHVVLGNHDLHLLATAHGIRAPGKRDTLNGILDSPECADLLEWLAQQPLARHITSTQGQDLLLVHAGVLPSWTLQDTLLYADEVQTQLRSPQRGDFLRTMYGNLPNRWDDALQGPERWRVVVNALTRLRFCTADGTMDFDSSESADAAPAGLQPWFTCPDRRTSKITVAFGHWSTLGLRNEKKLIALDTGCVWGGCLSALEISTTDLRKRHLHQVRCTQAQKPG